MPTSGSFCVAKASQCCCMKTFGTIVYMWVLRYATGAKSDVVSDATVGACGVGEWIAKFGAGGLVEG